MLSLFRVVCFFSFFGFVFFLCVWGFFSFHFSGPSQNYLKALKKKIISLSVFLKGLFLQHSLTLLTLPLLFTSSQLAENSLCGHIFLMRDLVNHSALLAILEDR